MENNSMGNKQNKNLDKVIEEISQGDSEIKIRERTKSCDKITGKNDSINKRKSQNLNLIKIIR
jgi:hypothetical protein